MIKERKAEDFPTIQSSIYVRDVVDGSLWRKRYLRSELGWIRIFKKETRNSGCILDIIASDIIDINTPMGSEYDRGQDTLIVLTFKRKEVLICAETTKVNSVLDQVVE